jgi:serine protease Do
MKQIVRKAAAPLALILGIGAAATAMDAVNEPVARLDAQAPALATGPADLATAFRAASSAALPGVVYVEVEAAPRAVGREIPDAFRGTPFEDFFRGAPGSARPQTGSGSGFIVSPDGYVMTNNHVVENASRVTVTLTDKREFSAEVVGRDPNTDVAVLKIDAQNLPTVRIGDPTQLQVGDWVLALGYPLSLGETVTAGIVSAKGRNIGIMRRNEDAAAPLEHFIQTDAAINPGNSGGPLVNLRGEVVGINTAIASPTGTYAGYGFAVPVHLAKRVADDLIQHGAVRRPLLGVQIADVTPADVQVFGLSDAVGAVVKAVSDGPASEAGVRLGDVIVSMDGEPVRDTGDLMERVALRQPGERVVLGLVRYGREVRVNVTLGSFPTEQTAAAPSPSADREAFSRLGFAASAADEGVVVARIDPTGPARQAGVVRGMVIERVNGVEIRSISDLDRVSDDLQSGATVSVVGRLPDGTRTIVNYRVS